MSEREGERERERKRKRDRERERESNRLDPERDSIMITPLIAS